MMVCGVVRIGIFSLSGIPVVERSPMPHLRFVPVGGYVAFSLIDWLLFMREGVHRPPRTLFQGQERLTAIRLMFPFKFVIVRNYMPRQNHNLSCDIVFIWFWRLGIYGK